MRAAVAMEIQRPSALARAVSNGEVRECDEYGEKKCARNRRGQCEKRVDTMAVDRGVEGRAKDHGRGHEPGCYSRTRAARARNRSSQADSCGCARTRASGSGVLPRVSICNCAAIP